MSEVTDLYAADPVFFDAAGHEISWSRYLVLEELEAGRFLNSLELFKEDKGISVAAPRTMMAQVAILGVPPAPDTAPALSGFDLRYYNNFGMKDVAAFDKALARMVREELLEQPTHGMYGLDGKAYELIPELHAIYDARQTRVGHKLSELLAGRRLRPKIRA